MDVSAGKEDLVVHFRSRQIGQKHAKSDGDQQQRLKFLYDAQVQQDTGNADHDETFPVVSLRELIKTCTVDKIQDCFHSGLQSVTG